LVEQAAKEHLLLLVNLHTPLVEGTATTYMPPLIDDLMRQMEEVYLSLVGPLVANDTPLGKGSALSSNKDDATDTSNHL
jgi:hypothetical protein